jgi:phospholipid transport system substrate-binding protein
LINIDFCRFRRTVSGLLAVLLVFAAAPVSADSATAVISDFNKNLLTVMQSAKKLGYEGRYAKLKPSVKATFDLDFMTRYSAGRHWKSLSKDQKSELVKAFSRLTIATYADRFKGYSGEKFQIIKEETPRKGTRLVRTELVKSDGERIKINYLLRAPKKKDAWKIIDIFVKGTISELSTKRSEYSSTLKNKGLKGLLVILEKKISVLGAESS